MECIASFEMSIHDGFVTYRCVRIDIYNDICYADARWQPDRMQGLITRSAEPH